MNNKSGTLSPFKIKNQLNQLLISDSLQRQDANKQIVNTKRMKAINRLIHIDEEDDYLLPQQFSNKQQYINNKINIKDNYRKDEVVDVANLKYSPNLRQNVHMQKQFKVQQIFNSQKIDRRNQTSQNKYTSSFKNRVNSNQLAYNSPIKQIQKSNTKQFFSHSQKPTFNKLFIPQLRSTKSQAHPNYLRQFLPPQQTTKSQALTAGSNPQQKFIKPQKLFIQNTLTKIGKYHLYCQICDELITKQDKHTCNKILNTFTIVNEQLDQILKIIQKYKLDQYYSIPELIKKSNKYDELQLLNEFMKRKKNNERTIKNKYEQQAVLSRLINISGKKMSLII